MLIYVLLGVIIFLLVANLLVSFGHKKENIQVLLNAQNDSLLGTMTGVVGGLGTTLSQNQQQMNTVLGERLNDFSSQMTKYQEQNGKSISAQLEVMSKQLSAQSLQNEQQMENMRQTIQRRIGDLQEENTKQLEKMQGIVDEKLQKTLDEKLNQSFAQVSQRLEQVYKGLGEMQSLAVGVGDLKKVLSNVKTRGILGEIQLGSILEEILSPEQYEQNIATKPGSGNVVEFAVKLPGDENMPLYLPIDAKFPSDAYANLMDAYDSGIQSQIEAAGSVLELRIKKFAKDISDKYICPPYTTDFGVMFLPTEGLYAEVVRRGMVQTLQHDYKINIAGPTTMAALLNSLQMGFKTLAIQKRSGEVWQILSAIKTEFENFSEALVSTQRRLEQAGSDLDRLVGVRTRQIQRKLKDVSKLDDTTTQKMLSEDL